MFDYHGSIAVCRKQQSPPDSIKQKGFWENSLMGQRVVFLHTPLPPYIGNTHKTLQLISQRDSSHINKIAILYI